MSQSAPPVRLMYLWLALAEMSGLYLALALLSRYLAGDFIISAVVMAVYVLAFVVSLMVLGPWRLWLSIALGVISVGVVALLVSSRITAAIDPDAMWMAGFQVVMAGTAWWLGAMAVPNDTALGGAIMLALGRWYDSLRMTGAVLRPPRSWMLAAALAAVAVPLIAVFFALSPRAAAAVVNGLSAAAGWLFPPPSVATSEPQFTFKLSCDFKPEDEGMMELPEPVKGSPQPLAPWVAWATVAFVLAVVIAGVVIAAMRFRWRRTRESVPVRIETVAIGMGLRAGLLELLRRIATALASLVRRVGGMFRPWASEMEEQATTVRAIYRSLLDWAARRGLPRLPSQTPLEYQRYLVAVYPGLAGDFGTITAVYMDVRYGRAMVADGVLRMVKEAWGRVRTSVESTEHARESGG